MKKSLSLHTFIILILAAALAFIPADNANANSLTDLELEIADYLSKPLERAEALYRQIEEIKTIEEGLARQNDITASRVIRYELLLDDIINIYNSIYFLQKNPSRIESSSINSDEATALSQTMPPYNFLFYLNFMEDMTNLRTELENAKKSSLKTKNSLLEAKEARGIIEREYRLCLSRINDKDSRNASAAWELKETEARLEQNFVYQSFYSITSELSKERVSETEEKLAMLEPVLSKVRANLKITDDDKRYLDATVFKKKKALHNMITEMNLQYNNLNEKKNSEARPTAFTKFSTNTEMDLTKDEVLFLLDLEEYWAATRLTWQQLQELLKGELSPKQQKQLIKECEEFILTIEECTEYCSKQIQAIRENEQETQRRFDPEHIFISPKDMENKAAFMESMNQRKIRYLKYIVDLGAIKAQSHQLKREATDMMKEHGQDSPLNNFWGDYMSAFINFELWHFGDYPVTVSKLFRALIAFLAVIIITHYIAYMFIRRAKKRGMMSEHNMLLVQKLIYYLGFAAAMLMSLWSLRIPLTAFAFLGGALAIALGLGTQKIMGDFFSGVLLLFQGKIKVGDDVIIGEERGIVQEITIQNTILRCQESKTLVIPNSKVQDSPIINLTIGDSIIRMEVSTRVAYNTDINMAKQILASVLDKNKHVLKKPHYRIFFESFGNISIEFTVQFFIDMRKSLEREAASSIRTEILASFEQANIEIPMINYPEA